MDLYTDDDPYYRETPMDSPIPPPGFVKEDEGVQAKPKAGGIGERLMKMAGWTSGSGLGKHGQGMVEPVSASDKHDRLGLGFKAPADPIKKRKHTVDLNRFIPHHQEFQTISCPDPFDASELVMDEIRIQPHVAVDYNLFCEDKLVQDLFVAKAQFDPVPHQKFITARRLANPYEAISKCIFINRAAVKMANMDAMFHFTASHTSTEPLTFADVCAGPGGFTEYLLWRTESRARGFGFTLKGEDDFTPWAFNRQPVTTFKQYYGEDNTGDVTKNANMKHFIDIVWAQTKVGLDLMTADGGFSVEGDENYQEEHLKQLVLCQFLTALSVLKPHGNFVCKVFDTFTPFVVGLVYIMYRSFKSICILKPYTSRPANSERYIVCLDYQSSSAEVRDHLFRVNEELNRLKKWGTPGEPNIAQVVPLERILADTAFVAYVREQNRRQAILQVDSLNELMKYVEDEGLLPLDQADVRRRCYKEWNLPDPSSENPREAMRRDSKRRDSVSSYDSHADRRGSVSAAYPSSYPSTPVPASYSQAPIVPQPEPETTSAMLSQSEYEQAQRQRAQERRNKYNTADWKKPTTTASAPTSAAPTPRSGSPVQGGSTPLPSAPPSRSNSVTSLGNARSRTNSTVNLPPPSRSNSISQTPAKTGGAGTAVKRRDSTLPGPNSAPILPPTPGSAANRSGSLTGGLNSANRISVPSTPTPVTIPSRHHSIADLEAAFNSAPTTPANSGSLANLQGLQRKPSEKTLMELANKKPPAPPKKVAAPATPAAGGGLGGLAGGAVSPGVEPRVTRKRAISETNVREDLSEEETRPKRVRVSVATEQPESPSEIPQYVFTAPTNPRKLTLRISAALMAAAKKQQSD